MNIHTLQITYYEPGIDDLADALIYRDGYLYLQKTVFSDDGDKVKKTIVRYRLSDADNTVLKVEESEQYDFVYPSGFAMKNDRYLFVGLRPFFMDNKELSYLLIDF